MDESQSTNAEKKTILWVDDHPYENGMEQKMLELRSSAKIEIATTTSEAMDRLKPNSHPVDLIISDVRRGGSRTEGFLMLRQIRSKYRDKAPPCIFYTGTVSKEKKREAFRTGAYGIYSTPEQLFAAVSGMRKLRTGLKN